MDVYFVEPTILLLPPRTDCALKLPRTDELLFLPVGCRNDVLCELVDDDKEEKEEEDEAFPSAGRAGDDDNDDDELLPLVRFCFACFSFSSASCCFNVVVGVSPTKYHRM